MSNKVSVLIPARNEPYLIPTVNDVLSKATGEVEVVVVLEDWGKAGYVPNPVQWAAVMARHSNLHAIYHNEAKGMRPALNAAAASAISRGAKYLLKLDAHCSVDEGWDTKLIADCDSDWVVVPRRKRLHPATWTLIDAGKPDIDYHYLSFPDDPNDFGGPGLNGKPWYERCRQRLNKPEYEIDDEMSSQGSGWFMHAAYFQHLGLMDEASYGTFWNEFQEIGLCCWLSGGQVKVNKRTWYAHWHKGKLGRGYSLQESLLKQGRNHTMKWIWNEAYGKQTRPFEWLIDHFWPVPSWPENWREVLYAERKPRVVGQPVDRANAEPVGDSALADDTDTKGAGLVIINAYYGVGDSPPDDAIYVRNKLQEMVVNDSLDLIVGNSVLGVGNPFRGQKKRLKVLYSFDGGPMVEKVTDERDWLIIGQSERFVANGRLKVTAAAERVMGERADAVFAERAATVEEVRQAMPKLVAIDTKPMSATALNDYLIRKFAIPSHRLRGPMPIELPHFHRDDLAQLFAELQFNRGAEIGVAEGKYSEVLMQANPNLELLLVDPWHHYSGNPQNKSQEKNEFAFNETKRRMAQWGSRATMIPKLSMDAVCDVPDGSLDWVYVDAHHGFPFVMMDLIMWSMKVRSGGIVAGDDLLKLDPKRWGSGPIDAVYAYTKAMNIEPWFICNAHRSVDYFWVRL